MVYPGTLFIGDNGAFLCIPMKIGVKFERRAPWWVATPIAPSIESVQESPTGGDGRVVGWSTSFAVTPESTSIWRAEFRKFDANRTCGKALGRL
jgi:hypothetical protein